MSVLAIEAPAKFAPLLKPSRYKGAHGGRGSGKSHFFAEQVALRAFSEPSKIVCIREVQESIKDSVKALIEAKIQKLGLGGFFNVLETEIRGRNGSLIIFRGMQSYNAENIKSLEGFDVAWVEEAQTLSDISLRMLRPTLRKEGSELWFSWNPRHDTDAVDLLLRGSGRPKDSTVIEVNWYDNPWFPSVLRDEKDADYSNDAEMADHVWGGGYLIISEGAYYAKNIAQAEREGRIGCFPYKPGQKVKTSWDLGMDDYTAIWFWVDDGFKATVVDYYETNGDGFDDIIAYAFPEVFIPPEDEKFIGWSAQRQLEELGREVPFQYAEHFLPHDVKVRELSAAGRHRYEVLGSLGLKNIKKGVAMAPEERISASRKLFPAIRFHKNARTEVGLKRLRRYTRKFNDIMGTYTTPLKDGNDHGADAFGEYAVNSVIRPPREEKTYENKSEVIFTADASGWIKPNMSVREIVEMKRKKRLADG